MGDEITPNIKGESTFFYNILLLIKLCVFYFKQCVKKKNSKFCWFSWKSLDFKNNNFSESKAFISETQKEKYLDIMIINCEIIHFIHLCNWMDYISCTIVWILSLLLMFLLYNYYYYYYYYYLVWIDEELIDVQWLTGLLSTGSLLVFSFYRTRDGLLA